MFGVCVHQCLSLCKTASDTSVVCRTTAFTSLALRTETESRLSVRVPQCLTGHRKKACDHVKIGLTLWASLSGTFLRKEGCRKPVLGVWIGLLRQSYFRECSRFTRLMNHVHTLDLAEQHRAASRLQKSVDTSVIMSLHPGLLFKELHWSPHSIQVLNAHSRHFGDGEVLLNVLRCQLTY